VVIITIFFYLLLLLSVNNIFLGFITVEKYSSIYLFIFFYRPFCRLFYKNGSLSMVCLKYFILTNAGLVFWFLFLFCITYMFCWIIMCIASLCCFFYVGIRDQAQGLLYFCKAVFSIQISKKCGGTKIPPKNWVFKSQKS